MYVTCRYKPQISIQHGFNLHMASFRIARFEKITMNVLWAFKSLFARRLMKVFFDIFRKVTHQCVQGCCRIIQLCNLKEVTKAQPDSSPPGRRFSRRKQRDNVEIEEPLVGFPNVDVVSSKLRQVFLSIMTFHFCWEEEKGKVVIPISIFVIERNMLLCPKAINKC